MQASTFSAPSVNSNSQPIPTEIVWNNGKKRLFNFGPKLQQAFAQNPNLLKAQPQRYIAFSLGHALANTDKIPLLLVPTERKHFADTGELKVMPLHDFNAVRVLAKKGVQPNQIADIMGSVFLKEGYNKDFTVYISQKARIDANQIQKVVLGVLLPMTTDTDRINEKLNYSVESPCTSLLPPEESQELYNKVYEIATKIVSEQQVPLGLV